MALISVLGDKTYKPHISKMPSVHGGRSGSFSSPTAKPAVSNNGSNYAVNDLFALNQYNTAMSQAFAREQMQFQAEQAQINRNWQEMMSNTAFQRQVEDLKKAGLNPILGFSNGGNGATTPSGTGSLSGSKGDVDTSAISAMAAIAAASINAAATVQVANIQNQAKPTAWLYNAIGSVFEEANSANPLGSKSSIGSLLKKFTNLLVENSSSKVSTYKK